jgi:hypothetical protein
MFAVPEQLHGQEEKEGGGAGAQRSPTTEYETHFGGAEEGSQTALNRESVDIMVKPLLMDGIDSTHGRAENHSHDISSVLSDARLCTGDERSPQSHLRGLRSRRGFQFLGVCRVDEGHGT